MKANPSCMTDSSIYGPQRVKPFRALCLEGASSCCFDFYSPMTYKLMENERNRLEKRVDLRPKCFNWPYLSLTKARVSSSGCDRENSSTQAVLTPKMLGRTQHLLCSVQCEPSKCGCGSVEQLWSLFSRDSKACFFLFSSLIMNHDVSTGLQKKQLGRLFDRWRRRLMPRLRTTVTFSFWMVLYKKSLYVFKERHFHRYFALANPTKEQCERAHWELVGCWRPISKTSRSRQCRVACCRGQRSLCDSL